MYMYMYVRILQMYMYACTYIHRYVRTRATYMYIHVHSPPCISLAYQGIGILEGAHPGAHDGGEDPELGAVLQLGEGDVVEVAGESWGDGVSATAWRTHGPNEGDVHQLAEGSWRGERYERGSVMLKNG